MYIRSWLYVPGDSDRKLAKGLASPADALVLDLEDSVAPENRPDARTKVLAALQAIPPKTRKTQKLWVRINAFDDSAITDLVAVMPGAPDGVVLPKIDGPEDVQRLAYYLDVLEAQNGIETGATKIVAVATETPVAALNLHRFSQIRPERLVGLNWGAEDLSAAIGASGNTDASGQWTLTYRWLRSTILMASKAAGVDAIETVFVDFRDSEGLERSSRAAAQEGFTSRAAIHPDQIEPINRSFSPSEEDVAMAEKIVDAFSDAKGVGTIGIDGKMFDIPHLKRARKTLELHKQLQGAHK